MLDPQFGSADAEESTVSVSGTYLRPTTAHRLLAHEEACDSKPEFPTIEQNEVIEATQILDRQAGFEIVIGIEPDPQSHVIGDGRPIRDVYSERELPSGTCGDDD
jgi:hypothetical protein